MSSNWIVKPKPQRDARLRLICLPFAGGSSNSFRTWAQLLPDSVELVAIEIPGRGQRLSENLRRRVPELVPEIAEVLHPELDLPFVIFGHSMGTILGYEVAHLLREKYAKVPKHLFFSGRGAPHLPSKESPIHQLPEDEFVEQIRNYNGTPKEVLEHKELMELMLPVLRADFEVCETYQHNSYAPFDCPITIFGGLQDQGAPRDYMEAWKQFTSSEFYLRMLPGDHFYLLKHEQTLIQSMLRDINQHFPLSAN